MIWQEGSPEGSDAWFTVYDPASATWSQDARFFKDAALERSFAPVWDDVGNLTLAYNKVEMLRTNQTLNLDDGGTLTLTNVPPSGRVDLDVLKRRLVRDLAIEAGDFTAEAENYLPNAAVTLRTVIRNAGDLAVQNPAVGFYDGDPKLGGTLVTNVTLSGWLEGSGTNEVTALWVLPESGSPHTVFAVVDPKGAKEDAGFTGNNRQSLRLGGTDLAVNLRSQTVETNGALRVVAEVRNLGAPTAGKSLLTLRKPGTEGGALVSAEVGTLEPGRVSQVALDLPEGSVAEGETLYALAVDEGAVVVDADRSNNTSTFAVTLVIDSDGDGMPDAWERQAGFDPSSAADALGDTDGDGVSNRDEYRVGTNPHEATSYLRLVGVGPSATGGVEVRWGSSAGRLYTLLRSDRVTGGWEPVARQLPAEPPENWYLDGSATNGVAFFYRVQVE